MRGTLLRLFQVLGQLSGDRHHASFSSWFEMLAIAAKLA